MEEPVILVQNTLTPDLNIDIPGLTFTDVIEKNGSLEIGFLGEYIAAVYQYMIGIGILIAIVFIMIGGIRHVFAAGRGEVGKAKEMMTNAVVGVILLLFVYLILYTVNPNLVFFESIELVKVEETELDIATTGHEGIPSNLSRATCDAIVQTAKTEGTCDINQSFASPTGSQPNCGNHHWFDEAGGDWEQVRNLDWSANWGSAIKAPFDAIVTYRKRESAGSQCGNTITLTGTGDAAGAKISICHAKDFTDNSGNYEDTRTVKQGETVGHVGGNCCSGETPPSAWSASKNGWCNVSGSACTDPTKWESCSCQPVEQSGNTSAPHVHVSWRAGGDLLSCLDY